MKYKVAVIGAGPAGMMAAIKASELGAKVVLIEKNNNLGVKLLSTGKGRCNITNKTDDVKELVKRYGKNGKFLFSCLHKFDINDAIHFMEQGGVPVQVERGNRVFPVSGLASDVLNVFTKSLNKLKVDVKTGTAVKQVEKDKDTISRIVLSNGQVVEADQYIICTGGKSYPETGSTGDGYQWAKNLGHIIVKPTPALTPVIIKERYTRDIEGLSLKNVEISIYAKNKKIDSRVGEALFTKNGMSGPIILDMSKKIQENLDKNLILRIDFKPALDFTKLDKRIQSDWQEEPNKMFKNSLSKLLPKKIIPLMIKLSEINPDKKVNSISKQERNILLHLLKEFKLTIKDLIGFKKAIITSGGIKQSEIDPKTMKSKVIDNLYFAGEIIDVDGPTGGYNLQVCWSTGYTAGESSASI